MTKLKVVRQLSIAPSIRPDGSSSAGLAGLGPAATKKRRGVRVGGSRLSARLARKHGRQASVVLDAERAMTAGWRKSASTRRTRAPASARVAARLRLPKVFPSPARALVTKMTFGVVLVPVAEKSTAVFIVRNASAICDQGSCKTSSSARPFVPTSLPAVGTAPLPFPRVATLGIAASVGRRRNSSTSSLLFMLLSKYSRVNTAPAATTRPARIPSNRSRKTLGELGRSGTSGRWMTRRLGEQDPSSPSFPFAA